jgi:hypothetical protein
MELLDLKGQSSFQANKQALASSLLDTNSGYNAILYYCATLYLKKSTYVLAGGHLGFCPRLAHLILDRLRASPIGD